MAPTDPLFAPMQGTERKDLGHIQMDVARVGGGRVKRVIYPAGFHWAKDMKPVSGTERCMHAHLGFLAHGHIQIEFEDGCKKDFIAPQAVSIEPGHDGRVIGNEPAVLIEFDFEGNTVKHLGMPEGHKH